MSSTRILLLTNSEHGQANVFLATAHALLTLNHDVEVHFASFPPIAKSVSSTSTLALTHSPSSKPITFHPISGLPMLNAWSRPGFQADKDGSHHSQGGLLTAYLRMRVLLRVTLPWTGPEFLEIFDSVHRILDEVTPHVVAVDPLFSPGLTAVRHLLPRYGYRYLVLSPNTIKDFAMPFQPALEAFWKFPCVGSGLPFPVPVGSVPLNVLLVLIALLASLWDVRRRDLEGFVRAVTGGARLMTMGELGLGSLEREVKVLVANRLALEFPLKVLPGHVVPCGPIVREARTVKEVDAELARWLEGGPTVYVNLGTHVFMSEENAVEMATGIRLLLDHARSASWEDRKLGGLRVLWKLTMQKSVEDGERKLGDWQENSVYGILGRDVEAGVVRIVEWIEAEPPAVLREENVVCAVHHGGANSFLETASAGIPQVVLPVWMDTFDFARRAELLGIGRWGNKLSRRMKGPWGSEFGTALIDVLLGPESTQMKERARELAKLCNRNGGGRVVAANMILKEAEQRIPQQKTKAFLGQNSGTD